jgi:ATP-dependent Clp protease protease subunit
VSILGDDVARWGTPPERPRPWEVPPNGTGASDEMTSWLAERLFDQRIVVLSGAITGPVATRTAAALLTLDALGAEPVRLHLSSPDGDLGAAFAIVDALDAMRAPVHALVTGQLGGAAVLVLAAADRRLAYRHARIRLSEPRTVSVSGTADEVAASAGQYLRELEELAERVATATGQPRSRIEDDLSTGRTLSAEQAREYGLVDEVVGRPSQDG